MIRNVSLILQPLDVFEVLVIWLSCVQVAYLCDTVGARMPSQLHESIYIISEIWALQHLNGLTIILPCYTHTVSVTYTKQLKKRKSRKPQPVQAEKPTHGPLAAT